MELKQSQRTLLLFILVERIWSGRVKRILLILTYTLLIFAFGAVAYSMGLHTKILDNVHVIPKVPLNFARGILAKPKHIVIDIRFEDFIRLAEQRELALAKGYLETGDEDYVPATIGYKDQSMEVRMRLKGDYLDHLNTDKWSFRIKVRGDNTLFGMKQFSIQHPKTRNYIYEWIYHRALKREGVLALRYEFIQVTLNGKDWGVYALEEHFERRLIEHNQLREGPIVRFNENLLFAERFQQEHPFPGAKTNGNNSYSAADIDTFQTNKMLLDPSSYAQYTQAIHLLESFRQGELRTSDVFDIRKLATFFAMNDLMGAQHSTNWQNLRFYYNPITSRLEPIGFDGDSGQPISAISAGIGPEAGIMFFEAIFNDQGFYKEYVKALERISAPSYLDTLLAELNEELEHNLSIIYSDYPYFDYSEQVFYRNQQYIQTVLNPIKGFHSYYYQSSASQIELELGNIQSIPIEVLSVSYKDSVLFPPAQNIILPGSPELLSEPVEYQIASFAVPEGFVWSDSMSSDLRVNYRLLGTSRMRQDAVFPWSHLGLNFVDNDFIRQEPNVDRFDFLSTDDENHAIVVQPGIWDLDQSLIIPTGYRLVAGEGTQLNLSNSATILSYSPLEFFGSQDHPVVIQSTDGTGQGMVVMNTDQTSVFEYVTFSNLTNPSQGGWQLTGAVTFYEAPVKLSHSQFVGSRSEDALNIVRAEFAIDRTLFSEMLVDAIDVDFARGRITSSSFFAIGNDAIDASGSVIQIQDVFINGTGDKGLSVGEKSQMTVNHIEITNSKLAVASKDLSRLSVQNVSISESEIGFAAYQKKPEFGPASLTVSGLEMAQVNTPFLVEVQSSVVVNDEAIKAGHENVYETLYGGSNE